MDIKIVIVVRATDSAADIIRKVHADLQRIDRQCLILAAAAKKWAAAFGALAGVANLPFVKLGIQAAERKAVRDLEEKR